MTFATRHGVVQALHGIDITLQAGETLGIVGESGSGKSVTALAMMRLLDRARRINGGRIVSRAATSRRAMPTCAGCAARRCR